MESLTVREAGDNLSRLVDLVAEQHKPIAILGQQHEAILIAKQDWDAIQETLYLSSIPGMIESIKKAAAEPVEECVPLDDLDW
ncbi:type II toxin-antitoxin system Phd/YefM family antitoxin [Synechococcus sp. PCC 7336]|uniref:type II toxin-antitoxin system Phd/YefM family antitoxin n=1 Tax=Synechococcus sp. PCC 7336 TaxID=195250 RepID=UPI0004763F16|nr:type II toxin-antitoxin system Phd/YefM family antitoxin [Synechococcus sp. PCC 7336]